MSFNDPYLPPDEFPDRLNPYAPPQSDLSKKHVTMGSRRPGHTLEPFSVDGVMRRSWEVFQGRLGLCLGIALGGGALNYAVTIPGNILVLVLRRMGVSEDDVGLISMLYMLTASPFFLWVFSGQTLAILKLARGRETSFADVFKGGRYLVRMILASFTTCGLIALAAFVVSIPILMTFAFQVRQPSVALLAAAVLLGIVAVMVVGAFYVRLSLYAYLLVDQDCGFIETLRDSFALTRGHVVELIALLVIAWFINLLGIVMCCVGLIFTVPLTMLMGACSYAMLVNERHDAFLKKRSTDIEFLEFDT